jgi:hypothetical protein
MRIFALLPALLVAAGCASKGPPEVDVVVELAAGHRGVLFIGNSLTFHNDLPTTVADLARAAGGPLLDVHAATIPGGTLEGAWEQGRAPALVRAAPWWAVVLQEQSERPLRDPDAMRAAARRLAEAARRVGARVVIFGTWPDRRAPETTRALDTTFRRVAKGAGAELALTGPAWTRALADQPRLPLWAEDGVHPTPAGTYLAACVLYQALTGASPVGLPHRTLRATTDGRAGRVVVLDVSVAAALQRVAAGR